MKTVLKFQSGEEFQNFFGQLCSVEIPEFQAVEGSGGDAGFDGLSGNVAYQVYFPEEKNRVTKNYINKIDTDLTKILDNKQRLGINVTEWIFVVPEDLRIEVVAHLQKKSEETDINCHYWGATKLLGLVTKYPYIQDSFPTIFLPPVREGIRNIQDSLEMGQKPRVLTSVEIIGDKEYQIKKTAITDEYKNKIQSFVNAHGTSSSAHLAADTIFRNEANNKVKELNLKKETSDKAYTLELDEINEYYDELTQKTNDEMARRGLFQSGIKASAIGKVEIKRKRATERLNLKFRKENNSY